MMEKYSVGKILSINGIDFSILSIIEYRNETYLLTMEYVEHIIPEHPKIVLLKDLQKNDTSYGTHLQIVDNRQEIESVLKELKL